MGNIENISISEIIALLCGFFTVTYCIIQASQKFLENMGWFQKRVASKKEKEREEHFNEWKEFYLTVKKETQSQEEKRVGEINNNINKLINSSNDMLRRELVDIYYSLPESLPTLEERKNFWFYPDSYNEINLYDYFGAKCNSQKEVERIVMEIQLYEEKGFDKFLRFCIFLSEKIEENGWEYYGIKSEEDWKQIKQDILNIKV